MKNQFKTFNYEGNLITFIGINEKVMIDYKMMSLHFSSSLIDFLISRD